MRTVERVGGFIERHKLWIAVLSMALLPACVENGSKLVSHFFGQ